MQQAENFKDHTIAFQKKLEHLSIEDITTIPYVGKYLAHLLDHKKYYLAIYADVLYKLIQHGKKSKEEISLIDFGSGNGLLGIFAKFCGFKKVFLNDIDANFIQASARLSDQLDIGIDGYVTGDIAATRAYFQNEVPDAIIGTDVIEHIYSLDSFFKSIAQINHSMITVFTTASNPANYFKVRALMKLQLKDELLGGTPGDNIFFGRSPLEPFLQIRKAIIQKEFGPLSQPTLLSLAGATRGLNAPEIISAVQRFNVSGELPIPAQGANTCDPLSGCWTERILSLKEYIFIYNSAGFRPVFYSGFYNVYETGFKKRIKKLLNVAITMMGKMIAPYIIIAGGKK